MVSPAVLRRKLQKMAKRRRWRHCSVCFSAAKTMLREMRVFKVCRNKKCNHVVQVFWSGGGNW